MSDEIREDNLDEAASRENLNETRTEDGADEKPQLIFGKFKDMETAEKSYLEAQRKIQAISEENARFKRDSELKSVLERMTEVVSSKHEKADDTAAKYQEYLEEVAEKFRVDPGVAIKDLQNLNNAWITDEGRKLEQKLKSEYEQKMSELLKEVSALKDGLTSMNPDYVENKEVVDSLIADGMPKAKAIEWAKKMRSGDRSIPVSLNGSRVREVENKKAYLTREDRARLKSEEGLTDADLDRMEAEYQQRAKWRR